MPRPKKEADGFYRRNFTYDGKKYSVRSKNPNELSRKMAEKLKELERGRPILNPEMKLAIWAEQWLSAYNTNLRPSSYERTRGILANHLCAHLEQMRLNTIRPLHLQQLMNQLAADGKSRDTIKHIQQTTKRLFESAKENLLIAENPADKLTLPRCAEPQSHRSLTARERCILLRTAKHHRAGLWVCLLLYTGLRPGEAAALDCTDIRDGFIRVDKALDGRTNESKQPKSHAGIRSIPIPAPLAEMLSTVDAASLGRSLLTQFDRTRKHRPTDCRHTKQSLKGLWRDFSAEMNATEAAMIARHEISPLHENLPPLTPYDLRHTYCTDLEAAGVSINVAKYLMGHSSIELTAKIYSHMREDILEEAALKIDLSGATTGATDNTGKYGTIREMKEESEEEKRKFRA